MTTSFSFSEYQMNVFNALKTTNDNIVINAVAGSGKTFTIVNACKMLNEDSDNVLFMAFNKSIAQELSEKLKGYAEVKTLHAFGFAILNKIYGGYKRYIKVDNFKYNRYIQENIYSLSKCITIDTDKAKIWGFVNNAVKLLNLCRVNLIHGDDKEAIEAIVDEHNLITLFDEVNVVSEILDDCYKFDCNNRTIDYTDMIVLPLAEKKHIPTFKYVFIDECQDLNNAQRELMLLAAKGGRFVAVGDRKQAINGFAGADCNSFDKIAALPNTKELPLSVNYRCGSNMIRLAQEIVPQIVAHEGAIEGEINHIDKLTLNTFKNNDMILCRKSAPLVGLCFKLLAKGMTAMVKGKDIADTLLSIIKASGTKDLDDLCDYLKEQRATTLKAIMRDCKCDEETAKTKVRYQRLDDNYQCIENLALNAKSVDDMCATLKVMFSDERKKNAIVLSTIHKSKGLEADRVMILLPNKLPMTWRNQKDWQLEQEINLKYVALTRAKKELIFVDMEEQQLAECEIDND